MLVINSKRTSDTASKPNCRVEIAERYLRDIIETVSIPRHYHGEQKNNQKVAEWIRSEFESLGLSTIYQGRYNNIVATYDGVLLSECRIIVGGHYDSVPGSPGADDNASAIAGVLALAKALKKFAPLPVMFVAFNREEDGLIGSEEFAHMLPSDITLEAVHILEMIGFCSTEPGSQKVPQGLPIKIRDVGDFIAVISNKEANHLIAPILKTAERYVPDLPVKALKVFFGVEKFFPYLSRSDHAPFWERNIPALMWTDTSEFRNPNYHKSSDTPDTLDYTFMQNVVQLLGETVLEQLGVQEEYE